MTKLMDPKDRLASFYKCLMEACERPEYVAGTTLTQVKLLIKTVSSLLGVTRVSVWEYNKDRSAILCRFLYRSDIDDYESGITLSKENFPSYFEAMETNRVIVAEDAHAHPATCEFSEVYLTPMDIFSMVDAPIYSSTGNPGVLCIEDSEKDRKWSVEEVSFITAVADKISLAQEHEAWVRASENLANAKRTDALTGLENRLSFQNRIEQYAVCLEQGENTAISGLIIIGMDGFSSINEQLGYSRSNEVLRQVANMLKQLFALRSKATARFSGDQFAIWMPNITEKELHELVGLLQDKFKQELTLDNDKVISVSASIGAVLIPEPHEDPQSIIRKAEIALAKAKENGRGSFSLFHSNWVSEYRAKKEAEESFLAGIHDEQFIPYYQPIINSQTGKIAGVESLIRWNHPSKGMLTPYSFLPLASEMRLMPQLGELMLRLVFRDIQNNNDLRALDWISINLSTEQLYSNTLVPMISRLLAQHKIPKQLIELEIVEEIISYDTKMVTEQLRELDELGIGLSIDDFGTGYSSLSRLKHLPVSKLKIDQSFVDGLPSDESDCCIASSIVGMAKGLNLKIVAEGVETVGQAAWLKAADCHFMQGYLYAKPMPLKELLIFIETHRESASELGA